MDDGPRKDISGKYNKVSGKKDGLKEERARLLSGSTLRTVHEGVSKALKLIKPYWTESSFKEKGVSAGLLGLAMFCTWFQVGATVDFNMWINNLFDAMQNDQEYASLLTKDFPIILGQFLFCVAGRFRASQEVGLRWRKWMTEKYVDDWMDNKAHYNLQAVYQNTDNPDQRIQEDAHKFTFGTVSLVTDAFGSGLTLARFSAMLWGLSGAFNLNSMGGPDVDIPGFMFWCALAFTAVGTYAIHKIGSPYVKIDYEQQKKEAFFRSDLIRVRENSEQIALDDGEEAEKGILKKAFQPVVDNYRKVINVREKLVIGQSVLGNMLIPFPYIMAWEFAKDVTWGVVMQTADAFARVQGAMSWFLDNYASLAEWKATTDRLTDFSDAIDKSNEDRNRMNQGGSAPPPPLPSGP